MKTKTIREWYKVEIVAEQGLIRDWVMINQSHRLDHIRQDYKLAKSKYKRVRLVRVKHEILQGSTEEV